MVEFFNWLKWVVTIVFDFFEEDEENRPEDQDYD